MADVVVALRTLVLQDTTIADKVGTQVYTDQLPQGKIPPSIVLFIESEIGRDAMDGPLGFDSATIRCECYGQTRPDADETRRWVRDHVGGYFGVVDGVFIQSVSQRTGQRHETVRRRAGSDVYQWVSRQDFLIGYQIQASV